jgi:hypothetical protein
MPFRFPVSFGFSFAAVCALVALFVGGGAGWAGAQERGIAAVSMSGDRPGGREFGRSPESVSDALGRLRRMAAAIPSARTAPAQERLMAELATTQRFVRGLGAIEQERASYQWHRVGGGSAGGGTARPVARPMRGMAPVSAISLEVMGGSAEIDRMRVFASSGAAYEFQPRKAIDTSWREGEVFLLGREIELVGIELIYRCASDGRPLPSLALHAGVSTLPPYAQGCAERLRLARRELAQGRLENAEAHARRAVALLEQHRRAVAP